MPCDTGLLIYCSSLEHTCKDVPRNAGDACKEGVCGYGLFCDSTSVTCSALRGAGESCAAPYTSSCDKNQGLACDGATMKCKSTYAQVGEACGAPPPSPTPKDCWQSVCVQPSASAAGTCTAYGLEGSPCQSGNQSTCADLLECTNGTCRSVFDLAADAGTADGGVACN